MLPRSKKKTFQSLFPPDYAVSFKEQTNLEMFLLDHSGFAHRGYKNNGEARLQCAARRPNFEAKRNNLIINTFTHGSKMLPIKCLALRAGVLTICVYELLQRIGTQLDVPFQIKP